MAVNRETIRDAFTTLLSSALTNVQNVYGYRIGTFSGASPVVVVSSSGIERKRATFQGSRATVYLQVDVFVLYSDGSTWNEDEAEDRLDAIEVLIAGVIDSNQATTNWNNLRYDGRSQRIDVAIGGVEYIREVLTVAVEVFG